MAFTGTFITHIKQVLQNPIGSSAAAEDGSINDDTLEVQPPLHNQDTEHSAEQTDNSNENTEFHYPGILAANLTSLTNGQKNFFIVTVTVLCVMSVFGNLSTLVVNFRRKIRPFFRACLISLALSDLMNTVFLSVAYLSQFTQEYVQIWSLGPLMCSLVPFATTVAILASSMTLVGIAVDRYYAVMKTVIGLWHPTVISCIVCMLCIWLASIGIACPVFTIYDILPVYILTEQHETDVSGGETTAATTSAESRPPFTAKGANTTTAPGTASTKTPWEMEASQEDLSYTLVREQRLVDMCISDQHNVTLYYAIVFFIIFLPCIGAFFWFNTIIARKLWKRRYSAGIAKGKPNQPKQDSKGKGKPKTEVTIALQCSRTLTAVRRQNTLQAERHSCNCRSGHATSSSMPSSLSGAQRGTTSSNTGSANAPPNSAATHNSREARHLRMFTIILLMMAVFLFLRLPAWIFLLMRMYGSYSKPIHWILYFSFGVMNLASSVLNPLFYTFLTETIHYILSFKLKVAAVICGHCSLFSCFSCHGKGQTAMSNVEEPYFSTSCCENFCGCQGFRRATRQCRQSQVEVEAGMHQHSGEQFADDLCSKDNAPTVNSNEKDEGVDCSDGVEDEVGDCDSYNCKIYTIYPASLVSSSVNSQ